MDIAQITSTYLSVPPKSHGGTEFMVYHLVEGLVGRGHRVELFASGDSRVSAILHAVTDVATSYDDGVTTYVDKEIETRNTYNLYRQGDRFDLIHSHWPTLAPYFSGCTTTPTIVTYAYIEKPIHDYYRATFPNIWPVCVSHSQARLLGEADLPVVYNGIDVGAVPFGEVAGDYLVIVGRIVPNKGISDAIRIAGAAGERLVIVGHVPPQLPWSRRYYEEEVRPHVDGDRVRHIEHLPNEEVLELVSRAKAFIFPLQWDEPFGLAVAEALAAGVPVVTYPKGAMPEIVIDGENGFLVETEDEAARAMARIGSLDRKACRRSIAKRFTLEGMVDAYEVVYRSICAEAARGAT